MEMPLCLTIPLSALLILYSYWQGRKLALDYGTPPWGFALGWTLAVILFAVLWIDPALIASTLARIFPNSSRPDHILSEQDALTIKLVAANILLFNLVGYLRGCHIGRLITRGNSGRR
jgi:hypothetical protein